MGTNFSGFTRGDRILFWHHNWCESYIFKISYPRLYRLSNKQSCVVNHMYSVLPNISLSWDFGFRRALNDRELEELMGLLCVIESVSLNLAANDARCWATNSGVFSCKSFFDCLLGNANSFNFEPFHFIWKSSVSHRVKVSAWLIFLGKLNTCDRVQRKNPRMMLSPNMCVICKKDEETANHLFLHCYSARFLWLKALGEVGLHWVAPASVRGMFLDRSLGFGSNKMAKTLWNCMVFSLLWHIWLERNTRIFEDKEILLEDFFEKAKFSNLQWAFLDKSFKVYSFSLVAFNWKHVIGIT
ncbi:hypothetical protein UlMin_044293 [Ulmus minor]